MKKIFTYFAVAALMAVACDDMYGPVETPTAPDKAGSVEIQIDTLGDDTLAFTIAPVGEASYYSYMVAKGPAQVLDSSSVYQCKLDAMIKGTFKAAEDSVATLTLGELAPNTAYTIYAVAGSPLGIPGSLSVKEVVTTDGVTLALVDVDTEACDTAVTFTFSEQVYLGKGAITARYFAINDDDIKANKEKGVVTAVADSILVDGNTVTVKFPGLPNGAYYAVCWPEGVFTDSAGNKVAALEGGFAEVEGKLTPAGVYSRKDTVAFALEASLPKEQQLFNDWKKAKFTVGTAVDSTLAAFGKAEAVVNYVTKGKVLTIDLVQKETYGFNEEGQSGVWMCCPEELAFGTNVVFSFPQDAFRDIWGNPTKAVELKTLYAYDYVLGDIYGSYAGGAYVLDFDTNEWVLGETAIKIEASDDEKKGNVKITEFGGFPCEEVYGTFNPQAATLTVPDWQYMMTHPTAGDLYFALNVDKEGQVTVFTMPEKGLITGPDIAFGIYLNAAQGGWVNLISAVQLELVEEAEGEEGAETTSMSFPGKPQQVFLK